MFDANYASIMASKPTTTQNVTLASMVAVGQAGGATLGLAQSIGNLTGNKSLAGPAAPVQQASLTGTVGTGMQVLNGANQLQQMMNAGANQLKAAKTQLTALTAAATKEGLLVNKATGTVTLGPIAQAKIHSAGTNAPAVAAYYAGRIAHYNAQIQLVVFQTNMADVTVSASLLKTGLDIVGLFTNNSNTAATTPATTVPTTALPSINTPVLTGSTPVSQTSAGLNIPATGGSTLAAGGTLGGNVPVQTAGIAMSGVGAGLNQPGSLQPTGLTGSGSVLTGAGGVRGTSEVSSAGRTGGSVMGVGGAGGVGAGGRSEKQREAKGWLLSEDDEQVWAATEVADTDDGVVR